MDSRVSSVGAAAVKTALQELSQAMQEVSQHSAGDQSEPTLSATEPLRGRCNDGRCNATPAGDQVGGAAQAGVLCMLWRVG